MLSARTLIVLIAVAIGLLPPSTAFAQSGDRLPFESVMRKVQARVIYATGNPVTWPPCCYDTATPPATTPAFPPNGYYGASIGPFCSVTLTAAIVDAVTTAVHDGAFLKESCWNITGRSWDATPLEYITVESLGIPAEGVTLANRDQMFALAQSTVGRLKCVRSTAYRELSLYVRNGVGSASAADLQTNCTGAVGVANANAIGARPSTWTITGDENAIGKTECAGAWAGPTPPVYYSAAVGLGNCKGKISFAASCLSSSAVSGASTVLYLAAIPAGIAASNEEEGLPADSKFHAYHTSTDALWTTPFLAEVLTELTIGCPLAEECPEVPTACCITKGWSLAAYEAISTLSFNESSTSGTCSQTQALPPILPTTGATTKGNQQKGGVRKPGCGGGQGSQGPKAGNGSSGGQHPQGPSPVDLATGWKVEDVLEFSVSLPAGKFEVTRGYCSNTELNEGNGICGDRWTMSLFTRLQVGTTNIEMVGSNLKENLVYTPVSTGVWTGGSPTTQQLTSTTVTIDGTPYNVYRLTEPGQWTMDFYSDAGYMQGHLLQEVDVYGNKQTYHYTVFDEYNNSGHFTPRLTAVYLNGDTEANCNAELLLDWYLPALPETSPAVPLTTLGKLQRIGAYRFDSNRDRILLQEVTYLYKENGDGWSPDLGTPGDLIQVVSNEAVDASFDLPFRTRVTQYRYHDGESASTTGNVRLDLTGGVHQLKHVIQPEQIEFVAQAIHAGDGTLGHGVVLSAANTILDTDDSESFASGAIQFIDVPSKIVGYGSLWVNTQYLQTSCGCSSGAKGTRETYTYLPFSSTGDVTTKITEAVWNGSSYANYRIHYYDMKYSASVPWLATYALEDAASTSNQWVWHFEYDTNFNLTKVYYPSVLSSYTPASSGAAVYIPLSTGTNGLVYGWVYNTENRIVESRVANANVSGGVPSFTLLSKVTYPSSGRTWLPSKSEAFRVAGSTTAADVETTNFEYGFHSDSAFPNKIAWVKTSVEREDASENGPSGTAGYYDTLELFDSSGLNRWSCSSDLTLTKRVFEPTTGAVSSITRNADPADLTTSEFAGIDKTGWGRLSDGGALTTTYTHDMRGRVTSRTTPGGVTSYTVRRMQEEDSDTDRRRVLYYTEVSLPHRLTDSSTFDGPISITWYNAADQVIRSSDYIASDTVSYVPLSLSYALGAEVARATTQHHLSGLVKSQRAWQDVSGTRSPAYYTTSFTYDEMGRTKNVVSPTGTITQSATYDVLGRVLETKVGTDAGSPGDMVLVAEYFYDGGGSATQGVGNGNLTLTRLQTGEDGTLAAAQRVTKRSFDYRGRVYKIENPAAPHQWIEYDNLDRVVQRGLFSSVPSSIGGTTESTRGLYAESQYSQRGLLYKQRVAIDATSLSAGFLESNYWFDSEGRTIAEWAPNSPGTKKVLDAHGRTKTLCVTDRKDDNAPGDSNNYTHASEFTNDIILEQTEFTYGGGSVPWPDRLVLTKTLRRNHDETAVGGLVASGTGAMGIATYVGYYYDSALRRTHTVAFGTNATSGIFQNDSAPTWPPSTLTPPSFGESQIVSAVEYGSRGLVARSIDPRQHATEYRYDDLSRRIAVIENAQGTAGSFSIGWNGTSEQWTVSGLSSTTPDQNRVTSFVYDAAGRVTKQIAHTSDSTSQVTQYNYGTTKDAVTSDTNSLVSSKDLLFEVLYPREDTGQPDTNPSTNGALRVRYAYDRLGELRSVVDQNTTKHTYTRDILGRVLTDTPAIPGSGSNIDMRIKRIGVTYDDLGRLGTVKSYDNISTSHVVNAVELLYTKLWQVEHLFQNVKGDVTRSGTTPSGDTLKAQYGYTSTAAPTLGTTAGNYSRLTSMAYPGGNAINYGYNTSGGLDDRISRLFSIANPSDSDSIVEYSRLGLDLIAVVDYPLADVQLDRTFSRDGKRRASGFTTQAAGVYPGWDRHGRVAIHAWVDGNLTAVTSGAGNGYPNRPPLVDEGYSYDAASNRKGKDDMRPGVHWASPDARYTYDDLDRLSEARKDTHTAGSSFGTKKGSQRWTLDVLGNWKKLEKELNDSNPYGDTGELENREHNEANEITNRYPNGTGNSPTLPFAYDHAGNLRDQNHSGSGYLRFTHDAWNRMVKAEYGGTPLPQQPVVLENEYNGLHWRTISRRPADSLSEEPGGSIRSMYYSAAWQLVEERIDDDYVANPGTDRVEQEVWGIRYIDDAIMRTSVNPNTDTPPTRYYHLTDVQFSTVAMTGLGADPEIKERTRYDAYGIGTHRFGYDVNDDGPVNSGDSTALNALIGKHIYETDYDVAMDLNRDGVISKLDVNILSAAGTIAALGAGEISDRSSTGPDNVFGYDGYVFAPELQRYCVRFRWYDPSTGRWMEKDPVGYRDSTSLLEYVRSRATLIADPSGLYGDPETWLEQFIRERDQFFREMDERDRRRQEETRRMEEADRRRQELLEIRLQAIRWSYFMKMCSYYQNKDAREARRERAVRLGLISQGCGKSGAPAGSHGSAHLDGAGRAYAVDNAFALASVVAEGLHKDILEKVLHHLGGVFAFGMESEEGIRQMIEGNHYEGWGTVSRAAGSALLAEWVWLEYGAAIGSAGGPVGSVVGAAVGFIAGAGAALAAHHIEQGIESDLHAAYHKQNCDALFGHLARITQERARLQRAAEPYCSGCRKLEAGQPVRDPW